jgi:hypothetical protein
MRVITVALVVRSVVAFALRAIAPIAAQPQPQAVALKVKVKRMRLCVNALLAARTWLQRQRRRR